MATRSKAPAAKAKPARATQAKPARPAAVKAKAAATPAKAKAVPAPAPSPSAAPVVPLANGDGVEAQMPVLGPSRIVWAFRPGNFVPMAVGKLYVVREDGSPHHLLQPRRRLAPGRYELMFARYGVRWPVNLTSIQGGDHPDDMLVWGRVPL